VSGCLTSQIGAHIIKVEDVRPARVVPFAEVQEDIGAKLRAGKRQALYRQFIDKLREKSYVEVLWK
jgi:parvulin-like peptidyl-prolyl isomerase